MAWNEKFTKKMEEHVRIIESFSPPCSAPVSQSSSDENQQASLKDPLKDPLLTD
jgi:hypothetical protein